MYKNQNGSDKSRNDNDRNRNINEKNDFHLTKIDPF